MMDGMTDAPNMTADEFKAALDTLNWSQAELAARTGLHKDSVWRMTAGRLAVPVWLKHHMALLVANKQLYDAHVAPWPRTRRAAGADQPDGDQP
jgi:hypothetical protein